MLCSEGLIGRLEPIIDPLRSDHGAALNNWVGWFFDKRMVDCGLYLRRSLSRFRCHRGGFRAQAQADRGAFAPAEA